MITKKATSQWFTSTGRILKDPPSGQLWNGNDSSRWWIIVECDFEIGDLYRWFLLRYRGIKLMRPAWGSHISIVRGEVPLSHIAWDAVATAPTCFRYENEIRDNGTHFWLEAEVEECPKIRKALGLAREPEFTTHLTLGMIPNQ